MDPKKWLEVERLYLAAVEKEESERAAFLREACSDEEVLREVESLLANEAEGDALMERPAWGGSATLQAGEKLGPYEIVSVIGRGGMGEVYEAEDTRLERRVAIKVCAPRFIERFRREARAIAALNHPNICTLHDVGSNYLVMELVDGETLAERLRKGPLDPAEALRLGVEIAGALAAAHERGIVHRDIKPGNVMLSRGAAKVLDFGLAKFAREAEASGGSGNLSEGMKVLGTLTYMAPEQMGGGECDARSDIYSFGIVLQEMLGQAAADGPLGRIILKCIARGPAERWQSAAKLQAAMEQERGLQGTAKRGVQRWPRWMAAAGAVVVIGIGGWWFWPKDEPMHVHFVLGTPEMTRLPMRMPTKAAVAVAPDGKRLVVVVDDSAGVRALWLRQLKDTTFQKLEHTEGASFAFWSPDSEWIGFFADGKLQKLRVSSGVPQVICEVGAGDGEGASWNEAGEIVFAPPRATPSAFPKGALLRVTAAGGKPEPASVLAAGELSHSWPQFLPGGKSFLYLARNKAPEKSGVMVQEGAIGQRKLVLANRTQAYFAGGRGEQPYLLFARDRVLLAQPFQLKNLELTGEPAVVAREVSYNTMYGTAAFSVAGNGLLVFRSGIISGSTSPIRKLTWFSRQGKRLQGAGPPGEYSSFSLSPDESRVAIDKLRRPNDPRNWDVWILELSSGIFSRLTDGRLPAWSPNGKRIALEAWTTERRSLMVADTETGRAVAVYTGEENKQLDSWSRDGRFLLFSSGGVCFRIPPVAGSRPEPVLGAGGNKARMTGSWDGKWIAYQSNETGRYEVYVESFGGGGQRRQVSNGGGMQPVWSRDGQALYYLTLNANLMMVEIGPGAVLESSAPRMLFETPVDGNPILSQYAVSGDGQRFLMMEADRKGREAVEQFHVELNWRAELGQGGAER